MRGSRIVVFVALLAVAAAGAALAAVVATGGTGTNRVSVTEREYKLTLSRTHLAAGKYTLVAVNKGKLAHSLEIAGPGIKGQRIAGTVKPGASGSLLVTLKAGSYSIWCPVPGHAALGMKTTLSVGAASSIGATTSSGGTTTKKAWG
jgi:plastocyanin